MSRIPLSLQKDLAPPESVGSMTEVNIPVPYRPQLLDGWCWAATIEMIVLTLTGQDVQQCQLANLEFQRNDCCPTNPQCDYGVALTSFAGILMNWGIDSQLIEYPLSFEEVQQQIANDYPIIYNLTFQGDVYHTGIIADAHQDQYGNQWVYFLDSDLVFFQHLGRAPYGWVAYAYILNAYGLPGNWTETIFNIQL